MPSTDSTRGPEEPGLQSLLDRLDLLEAEVQQLRSDAAPAAGPGAGGASALQTMAGEADRQLTRRRMLQTGGGVAAAGIGLAVTGGVLAPEPASAASGGTFILGQTNDAGTATTEVDTAIGNYNPTFVVRNTVLGDGIQGYSTTMAGVRGAGTGAGTGYGVQGISTTNNGVIGSSTNGNGVMAESIYGAGIFAVTNTGIAGRFDSTNGSQLVLVPTRQPPLEDTTAHDWGEIITDYSGDLWHCAETGSPGTWRKLAGPNTAGALHVLPAPVRVYDSRYGTQPPLGVKSPLVGGTARPLDVTVNSSGVPTGATAAMVTCLLVNTVAGAGNFTIWANGVARPLANNMVWGGTAGRFSSPAVTALDATGQCQVVSSVKTDFVLDVVGYYI